MGRRHVKNKRFGAREFLKILLYEKLCGRNANHRTRAREGSLRSDQTRAPLGCYVATEFEPKLSRYVATKRPFRSVATFGLCPECIEMCNVYLWHLHSICKRCLSIDGCWSLSIYGGLFLSIDGSIRMSIDFDINMAGRMWVSCCELLHQYQAQGLEPPEHLSSDLLHYADDPPGHTGLPHHHVQESKSQPCRAAQYRSMFGLKCRSISDGRCRSTVESECRLMRLVSGSTVVDENRSMNLCCCRSMRNVFLYGLNTPSLQDLMRIAVEFHCCFWYCWACI
ncbi:hypothetical protein F2Q69_00059341 [Brassica cretica]|uniref:Uncharacterized protein n=1 Tax=Brassica cretica TaxID=69181 RepID=A0A8S9RIC8_BRACR|nr:hypothetical protein F2Q69_00059341 [Brassica cretica]